MGNTIKYLKNLQEERDALKNTKKTDSPEAKPDQTPVPPNGAETVPQKADIGSGRHNKEVTSILFITLILVLSIALTVFLKGYGSEMGRIAVRMDKMELSVIKNSDQIKEAYKDVQALKKEIDTINTEIANIGADNEQVKKAGARVLSEMDYLIKSQNAIYKKVNSLEESLKTKQ